MLRMPITVGAFDRLREAGSIVPIGDHQWLVPSHSEAMWRLVRRLPGHPMRIGPGRGARRTEQREVWTCTCPTMAWIAANDFGDPHRCKHVIAVQSLLVDLGSMSGAAQGGPGVGDET